MSRRQTRAEWERRVADAARAGHIATTCALLWERRVYLDDLLMVAGLWRAADLESDLWFG